jgi:hypothetical protein
MPTVPSAAAPPPRRIARRTTVSVLRYGLSPGIPVGVNGDDGDTRQEAREWLGDLPLGIDHGTVPALHLGGHSRNRLVHWTRRTVAVRFHPVAEREGNKRAEARHIGRGGTPGQHVILHEAREGGCVGGIAQFRGKPPGQVGDMGVAM